MPDAPTRATLGDIPADVLFIIFDEIYRQSHCVSYAPSYPSFSQEGPRAIRYAPTEPSHWPDNDDLLSEALFPDAFASVCRLWKEVLEETSVFWTRLIIRVDGDKPTPLSKVEAYLRLSKEYTLDIHILRHPGYDFDGNRLKEFPPGEDPAEVHRSAAAMRLIRPHFWRCRIFRAHTLHGRSLPRIGFDICGELPYLIDLRLQAVIEDDMPIFNHNIPDLDSLHLPKLEVLYVRGLNFAEAFAFNPSTKVPPNLKELSIAGYHLRLANPSFRVLDLVRFIHRLRYRITLEIIDLDMDCETYTGPRPPRPRGRYSLYETVTFENMRGEVISEFWRLTNEDPDFLIYKRCNTATAQRLINVVNLTLIDMQTPEDVLNILEQWDDDISSFLDITDCPGFDSSVVRALGMPSQHGGFICSGLKALDIKGCRYFFSGDLRRALQSRYQAWIKAGRPQDGGPVKELMHLAVYDCRDCDPRDQEWFDQHVAYASWNEWSGGRTKRLYIAEWQSNSGD